MIAMLLVLLSFFFSARAEEPVQPVITAKVVAPVATDEAAYDQSVRDPQYGVNLVAGSNCNFAVKANGLTAAKAALLATALQEAKAECLAAQRERASAAQRDAANATLTSAEATLISAAAIPAANGGSVSFSAKPDGTVSLDTGAVAEIRASYQAYGQVLGGGGLVNPRDWLLTQSRMGLSGPQVQTVAPQPAASTGNEAELRRALEAKDALIRELSGS